MRVKSKRFLALLLCFSMLFAISTTVLAADEVLPIPRPNAVEQIFYNAADAIIKLVANIIGFFVPADTPEEYVTDDGFMPGMDEFISEPQGDAVWSVGYSSASLIPDGYFDPVTKEYIGSNDVFVAGGLVGDGQRAVIDRKTPTELLDDQRIRVTAINDGSGRGTVVLASIDAYAFTSNDVRIIRKLLTEFSQENNIVSINIAALHQHSVIDTLGMNGPILQAFAFNPLALKFGKDVPYSGKNAEFMEKLHNTVAQTVKNAVADMREGELRYGAVDADEYIRDKRLPIVYDNLMHRFRFIPADGSKETWIVNYSAHCTSMGAGTRIVTSDYPHYMEEAVAENANFMLIQGAQLAITHQASSFNQNGETRIETMQGYGRALGNMLIEMGDNDEVVSPILNIRSVEYYLPLDNPLHLLLFRLGMIKSASVKSGLGTKTDLICETAYMEIGDNLAIMFAPGEMEPALAFGGGLSAELAYTGKEFNFTPMKDMTGGRELIVFGIMNDHSGYYILPNDVSNFVLFGNEEINAVSPKAAERLLDAFSQVAVR